MDILGSLILGAGLSMDAFAVSVCKGLSASRANLRNMAKCGVWFGGFQALMPLSGFFIGNLFAEYITAVDHWIAFSLLILIGVNMLREAMFADGECDCEKDSDFSAKTMLAMAVATSIDAFAVGVGLAMAGDADIWVTVSIIGAVTCCASAAGVKIGSVFGNRFGKKARIAGGGILIIMGFKILFEHLRVI